MSKTYFIGDLHYGHKAITDRYRKQFSSNQEHDAFIHNHILESSDKRNNLYLLGDVAFDVESFAYIKEYIKRFQSVSIILGNHDHKDLAAFSTDNGAFVYGLKKKNGMWLSHCPIHPSERWNTQFNVHGHLHNNVVQKIVDGMEVPDPYYVNVCCEFVNFTPLSLEKIREGTVV